MITATTFDLRVSVEPQQGGTYADQLAVARAAEAAGYSAFLRSDHYLAIGGSGLPGPTDAWITLAGIARETSSIRLGTMVSSASFRLPGHVAITVAQVDDMSSGRVEFGIGAGWFEAEHKAYGIPFPNVSERFDRLTEQLAIITGLWSTPVGAGYDFAGKFYTLENSPALPKPLQHPHPPIIIGGTGRIRTPALAARYAAEFNVATAAVEVLRAQYTRVRAEVDSIGRDPASLTCSTSQLLCIGRNDGEVARRANVIDRHFRGARASSPLVGTPNEIVDKLGAFMEAGVQRLYLVLVDMSDIDQLELFAGEVKPQLS